MRAVVAMLIGFCKLQYDTLFHASLFLLETKQFEIVLTHLEKLIIVDTSD